MKKKVMGLLLASLLLTACANSPLQNLSKLDSETEKTSASKKEKTTSSQEVTTQTEEESTTKTEAVVTETYTYQYDTKSGAPTQTHSHTLTYQGDKFITIKMEVVQPLDETNKANAQTYPLDEARAIIVEKMNENEDIKMLKSVKGVTLNVDLTENYEVKVNISFDMATLDKKALSAVGGSFGDMSIVTDLSPSLYIAQLKLQGAKKAS